MYKIIDHQLAEFRSRYRVETFSPESRRFFEATISGSNVPLCLTDPNLPDNPIVYANHAFQKLTGYDRVEIVGRNCRFLQGPKTTPESIQVIREAIDRREAAIVEIINYRKDGTAFINALHLQPMFDENDDLVLYYGAQTDVTETYTIAEARRRKALSLAGIGVWEHKPETQTSIMDTVSRGLFDMDESQPEFPLDSIMSKIHPDDLQRVTEAIARSTSDPDYPYDEDFRITLEDGTIRWIRGIGGLAASTNIEDDDHLIGVSFDVTREKEYEAKLAEAHDLIKITAQELDHRINNIFAMVSSLVSAGARGDVDARTAAEKTRQRIMALSKAHALTSGMGVQGRASLKYMFDGVLAPYLGTNDVQISGDDIGLDQKTASSLGLILHELTTNAVKYGALNSPDGRLDVTWTKRPDGPCEITWQEFNAREMKSEISSSSGFGSRLIKLSANQMGGESEQAFLDSGLLFKLSFPLDS